MLNLPLELQDWVCRGLALENTSASRAALVALLQTSHHFYDLAAPRLYETVTITSQTRLFVGLQFPARGRPDRYQTDDGHDEDHPAAAGSYHDEEDWWSYGSAQSNNGESDDGDIDDADGVNWDESTAALTVQSVKRGCPHTGFGYPTRASHERKLALLRLVRKVVVASVPALALSAKVDRLVQADKQRGARLFSTADTVVIRSEAVWHMADWSDRHRARRHPLLRALQHAMQPRQVCWTYPHLGEAELRQWTESRSRGPTGTPWYASVPRLVAVRTREMRRFVAAAMEDVWQPAVLCVHGAVSEQLPEAPTDGATHMRVFFDYCSCYYDSREPCHNAVSLQRRVDMLREHLLEKDGSDKVTPRRGSWELVDAAATLQQDETALERVHKAFWQGVDRREDLASRVQWTSAETAASCAGCGLVRPKRSRALWRGIPSVYRG